MANHFGESGSNHPADQSITSPYRWKKSEDNIWSCAIHGRILSLRQDTTHLHYQAIFPETIGAPPTPPSSIPSSIDGPVSVDDDTEAFVRHYLNLGPHLTGLYEQWSAADLNFKQKAPKFAGVRILKQDSWEALVGFICSSNNNIIRISQMVSHHMSEVWTLDAHWLFVRWISYVCITDR